MGQFQGSFRAVSEQSKDNHEPSFQCSFRAVSEQFQSSFRAVSEQFKNSFDRGGERMGLFRMDFFFSFIIDFCLRRNFDRSIFD